MRHDPQGNGRRAGSRRRSPHGKFDAVNALGIRLAARVLSTFLAVALTDLPIVCMDEWGAATTSPAAAVHLEVSPGAPGISGVASSPTPSTDPSCVCACPCHLTFSGPPALALSPLVQLREGPGGSAPGEVSPPVRLLDHPPQNLA
jgi:hypothetical protein